MSVKTRALIRDIPLGFFKFLQNSCIFLLTSRPRYIFSIKNTFSEREKYRS